MRTNSMTGPADNRWMTQRCACCDGHPLAHTPEEIDRAARAHQQVEQEWWEELQSLLPAMREEWAPADAQVDPLLWCPPEWVVEEEARRRAERRARRVERVPAQRPAPEPEPLREPPTEVLAAFGLIPGPAPAPTPAPEPEPEAEEVDPDADAAQADEGPRAVLGQVRVRDGRTAQEVLHDADREHLSEHKTPRWRRTSKLALEAPWIANEDALPESVRELARMTYDDGRHALTGAAISMSMGALAAGWTPLQVELLLQDRHVPISVLCTHREPGGSQAGRPRSEASAQQHAQRIVSIAQQHLREGLPLAQSGHVPVVVREIRQVLLEHSWRGRRGRHDLAVLLWLLDRAAAVHQVVLHASARETGLAVGASDRTASRCLISLQQRGFLSLSTDPEERQHDNEDAYVYRLRVPVSADRYCLTAGQRHVAGSGAGAGSEGLIGIDALISTTAGRSPEQCVNTDQDVWVSQGAALMAWVMGHDLWTRDGLGHSAARVAWELHEHGEARTQRDLAGRTGLAQSTVAGALKALRGAGLAHLHIADLLQPLTREVLDSALVRVDADRLPEVPTATGARQRAYERIEEQRAGRRRARHHWAGRARHERLSRVCAALPELGWAVVDDGGVAAVMDTVSGAIIPDRVVHEMAPQWHTQDVREALRGALGAEPGAARTLVADSCIVRDADLRA